MLKSKVVAAAALAVAIGPLGHAQGGKGAPALSAADREEIRVLNAKYSLALGQCDPDHWPLVFAQDGFFASMGRGRVLGHHRLGEMNRSYDCVYGKDGKAPDHAPAVSVPSVRVSDPVSDARLRPPATSGGAPPTGVG